MLGRGVVRRFGLAAIPVLLLAQCAPQCTAGPVSPPVSTSPPRTTDPLPPPPTASTTVAPPELRASVRTLPWTSAQQHLVSLSGDGRAVGLTQVEHFPREETTTRLDVDTGASATLPVGGLLTADGGHVVGPYTEAGPSDAPFFRYTTSTGARDEVVLPPGSSARRLAGASADGTAIVAYVRTAVAVDRPMLHDGATSRWTDLAASIDPEQQRQAHGLMVSADGRSVVFAMSDQPGGPAQSIWLRPTGAATLERITVAPDGRPVTDGYSDVLDISSDGRFVLFSSNSLQLMHGGSGPWSDPEMFVRDRLEGTTTLVPDGRLSVPMRLGGSISDDGRRVAFMMTRPTTDRFGQPTSNAFAAVYDRPTGRSILLTDTAHASILRTALHISDDGRRVVFGIGGGEPLAPEPAYLVVADVSVG